jgi:hypothetical protein
MTLIGKTNHAFAFDGLSDSIIVPQGYFRRVPWQERGDKVPCLPEFT